MDTSLYLIVCLITCQLFYGMEDNIKEIIVANVDINIRRYLAVLDKSYNSIIESKYRPGKKCIELLLKEQKISPGFLAWNYDFSQCAWFNKREKCHKEGMQSCIELTLASSNVSRKELTVYTHCWNTKDFCLFSYIERPYFDKQGSACVRCLYNDNLYKDSRIQECSLNSNGVIGNKPCFFIFCYKDEEHIQTFSNILHLPSLLRAILDLMEVKKQYIANNEKMYTIEKVIIPDTYKIAQDSTMRYSYQTYDQLPDILKGYFDDVITKQQKK